LEGNTAAFAAAAVKAGLPFNLSRLRRRGVSKYARRFVGDRTPNRLVGRFVGWRTGSVRRQGLPSSPDVKKKWENPFHNTWKGFSPLKTGRKKEGKGNQGCTSVHQDQDSELVRKTGEGVLTEVKMSKRGSQVRHLITDF
jgi:hypothetical protein